MLIYSVTINSVINLGLAGGESIVVVLLVIMIAL